MKISVEGEEYPLNLESIRTQEAIALQKNTGMTIKELMENLQRMDAVAIAGVVWLAWSRAGHNVPFDKVDFDIMTVQMVDDSEEGKSKARPKKTTK